MKFIRSRHAKKPGSRFHLWRKTLLFGALSLGAILNPYTTIAEAAAPNIIFLLSDDQRPDTIAALGNPVIKTPHLDSLAASGVSFARATCGSPLCVPSRAQILTGTDNFRNGVGIRGRSIDRHSRLGAALFKRQIITRGMWANGTTMGSL